MPEEAFGAGEAVRIGVAVFFGVGLAVASGVGSSVGVGVGASVGCGVHHCSMAGIVK